MQFSSGTRLGPYEVQAPLGAGGMGEVYRARDTRLDRTVAVKVLAPAIARDPVALARFEREARAAAALDHPHICGIYDVGEAGGTHYLVMPLLDGHTLAARLHNGPLPLVQALAVAVAVADALDRAHRHGIVHRDLKPANVMLTKTGAKLLDFGLAKLRNPQGPLTFGNGEGVTTASVQAGTAQGTLLGTVQYMAPEQVEGKEADARSDIWAMGVVLYEMITGARPFNGETPASVMGAILKDVPPPVTLRQPLAPVMLERALARCLEKDPDLRWQSAADLNSVLRWVAAEIGAPAQVRRAGVGSRSIMAGLLLVAAIATVLGVAALRTGRAAPPVLSTRLTLIDAKVADDVSLVTDRGPSIALSPDGGTLAFVARRLGEEPHLFVRHLDQLAVSELPGTQDARTPFFSPDNQWIGFFGEGKLKKVSAAGGTVLVVCEAPNSRGGSWGEDGTIVFTPSTSSGTPLFRVAENGGTPVKLSTLRPGEAAHRWPQVLPGARGVLYSTSANLGSYNDGQLLVQPLPSGEPKVVMTGGFFGRYLRSGHLTYLHDGRLFAAPFDLNRLEVTGPAVPVLDQVSRLIASGAAQFDASVNGTAVYLTEEVDAQPLQWLTRDGQIVPLKAPALNWSNPRISPDGRRIALDVFDGIQTDIWIYDTDSQALTPFTFDPAEDWMPTWSRDGAQVVFRSSRKGPAFNIYAQAADGGGQPQALSQSANPLFPGSWHPMEDVVALSESNRTTNYDIVLMKPRERTPNGIALLLPLLNGPAQEFDPAFSPDGKWIAYVSNEAGRSGVYVRPYPGTGGQRMVAPAGYNPTWSRARPELLYMGPDQRVMVITYADGGGAFRHGQPRPWSSARGILRPRGPAGYDGRGFDLHPDGNRAIGAWLPESAPVPMRNTAVLVFNLFDKLRRIAPPTS